MSPRLRPDDHPAAPKYWRHETGGELAVAVMAYLNRTGSMTVRQISLMRAYLQQWVGSPVWDMNPAQTPEASLVLARLRYTVLAIHSVTDIRNWIHAALDAGIDPL